MTTGCMNPIIFMDELDKVSNTTDGIDVQNLLIHLTDPVQNMEFHDKYFAEIDFDLSKCLFILQVESHCLIPVNYSLAAPWVCPEHQNYGGLPSDGSNTVPCAADNGFTIYMWNESTVISSPRVGLNFLSPEQLQFHNHSWVGGKG